MSDEYIDLHAFTMTDTETQSRSPSGSRSGRLVSGRRRGTRGRSADGHSEKRCPARRKSASKLRAPAVQLEHTARQDEHPQPGVCLNRLFCGDNLEVLQKEIRDESVDQRTIASLEAHVSELHNAIRLVLPSDAGINDDTLIARFVTLKSTIQRLQHSFSTNAGTDHLGLTGHVPIVSVTNQAEV